MIVPRRRPRMRQRLPPLFDSLRKIGVNEVPLRKIEETSLEYTWLLTASPKLGCGVPAMVILLVKIFVMAYVEQSITYL